MSILSVKSLRVNYGPILALDNIWLEVDPGEIVALIGPNGAGKTTLIRAVSGVVPTSAGSVFVSGYDVSTLSSYERARNLAVVPQARDLPPFFTVWQTVMMGRTPYLGWMGKVSEEDRFRVQWAMERTRIIPLAERRVQELSGGEQQLVLLARALAQETPIMLLDEPTAHLDLKHQSNLLEQVRTLVDEGHLAVLMAMHDLNLVSLYANRVALLANGKMRVLGTPQEVISPGYLNEVYQVPLHIIPHPDFGNPLVLPDGSRGKKPASTNNEFKADGVESGGSELVGG
jgi:ABC-type cobalamin/Fe3+-siderophores transport system ATPase subunit